jgi:hypothetical protein
VRADNLVNLSAKSKEPSPLAALPGEESANRKLLLASKEQEPILDRLFSLRHIAGGAGSRPPRAHLCSICRRPSHRTCRECLCPRFSRQGACWIPKASVGEAEVRGQAISEDSGLLSTVAAAHSPILRTAAQLKREDYSHVDTRKTLVSLSYLPLVHNGLLIGALEILSFEEELSKELLATLLPATNVAGAAIASAQVYEQERHGTLTSITRLTQLYDLEKVFASRCQANCSGTAQALSPEFRKW